MIGDADLKVAKLYNMLPADEVGADGRTAANNNATVRSVFIVGPDKKDQADAHPTQGMTTGRNFDEILRVLDSDAAHRQAQGRHAGELGSRATMWIITPAVSNRRGGQGVPGLQDHQTSTCAT